MMKAKVITLGCKVNQYESEAMLSSLLQHGFAAAEDKETADVVILNSWSRPKVTARCGRFFAARKKITRMPLWC